MTYGSKEELIIGGIAVIAGGGPIVVAPSYQFHLCNTLTASQVADLATVLCGSFMNLMTASEYGHDVA